MIISCENCNKKFDIKSELIPEYGRLLECSSCNHQWFFKIDNKKNANPTNKLFENDNENLKKNLDLVKDDNNEEGKFDEDTLGEIGITDINKSLPNQNKRIVDTINIKKNTKKTKILNLIIVFIVSFIALIIIVDTFKNPISKIIPNVELILYNLYESIKDMKLFLIDLM
tara:strand:+ start:108 stop:617 length:510 start_codon:yes stop_codon:yes gene_type:complete